MTEIVLLVLILAVGGVFAYRAWQRRDDFTGGLAKPSSDTMNAAIWRIGPTIHGVNHSVGVPEIPLPHPEGWYFDIPYPDANAGHVHYVTFHHGPLTGKRRLVLRYRIEADEGVVLHPRTAPGGGAMLTLYFQRKGDDWSGQGKYDAYRQYATFATVYPLVPGEGEIVAPLDGAWTGTMYATRANDPAGFDAAVREAQAVGFVLGGGSGYGHGAYASGPAWFVVTAFLVE